MKSLFLALAIVATFSLAIFATVHAFGVGEKVAAPLASSALGFITFIHDKVEKALSAGKSPITPGIVPVAYFRIESPLMLLYATLIFIALVETINFVEGVPASLLVMKLSKELPVDALVAIGALVPLPMIAWCTFALGRWVGTRSARSGYWILPLAILLGRSLELAVIYFASPEGRQLVRSVTLTRAGVMAAAATLAILMGCGTLGVWRGNRVRFGAYFNSLLKQVSQPTRDALLEMAFEEARAKTVPAALTAS